MNYLEQVLIAFDQLLNAMGGGMADETLSARAYRLSVKGNAWPAILIDGLFFWQDEHCYNAYLSELNRKHLPPEYNA
jgi:hypothetical protein